MWGFDDDAFQRDHSGYCNLNESDFWLHTHQIVLDFENCFHPKFFVSFVQETGRALITTITDWLLNFFKQVWKLGILRKEAELEIQNAFESTKDKAKTLHVTLEGTKPQLWMRLWPHVVLVNQKAKVKMILAKSTFPEQNHNAEPCTRGLALGF